MHRKTNEKYLDPSPPPQSVVFLTLYVRNIPGPADQSFDIPPKEPEAVLFFSFLKKKKKKGRLSAPSLLILIPFTSCPTAQISEWKKKILKICRHSY
jgi:hypothetical protein